MSLAGEIKALVSIDGIRESLKGLEEVGNKFKDTGKAMSEVGEKFKEQAGKIKSVGDDIGKVGKGMMKSITIPLATGAIAVSKFAMDFEKDMAKVSTLLRNDTDIKAYGDAIKTNAREMNVSLNEYSEATYSAISAGVEQGKAVGFVTEAVKLAKGGFTDTSTAVDVLTTAINSYGLEADDATKVSDYLITTQNLGKLFAPCYREVA